MAAFPMKSNFSGIELNPRFHLKVTTEPTNVKSMTLFSFIYAFDARKLIFISFVSDTLANKGEFISTPHFNQVS